MLTFVIRIVSFGQKKRILSLDVGLLIAGAKERGELEGRVTMLLKEIKKSGEHLFGLYVSPELFRSWLSLMWLPSRKYNSVH